MERLREKGGGDQERWPQDKHKQFIACRSFRPAGVFIPGKEIYMSEKNNLTFGECLQLHRKRMKMSQQEFARKCDVSLMSIRRYESGVTIPNPRQFKRLIAVLPSEDLMKVWLKDSPLSMDNPDTISGLQATANQEFMLDYITEAEPEVLDAMVEIAEAFRRLKPTGVDKCLEMINMVMKIPEYRQ